MKDEPVQFRYQSQPLKFSSRDPAVWLVVSSAVVAGILFLCSSTRHLLFHSGGYDLGIFDQALYLLSQGENPFVTIRGIHILGDHAALILYPLSLLYKIIPSVYGLLGIQALALASGGFLCFRLSRQAGLTSDIALVMAGVYWGYPLVFNVNLFDFHPDVIAVPALLAAVLAFRVGSHFRAMVWILVVLSCKAVFALTVMAVGIWWWGWEGKRLPDHVQPAGRILAGWILVLGSVWFGITAFGIIPYFSGADPAAVSVYGYLGDSVRAIIINLILRPDLVLRKVLSLETLGYCLLLSGPLFWGLSFRYWDPLIPALPALGLNILSSHPAYRDLVHHYSLPILPFLIVLVVDNLIQGRAWIRSPRWILGWTLVSFLALAKYGYFGSLYLSGLETWSASRIALTFVNPEDRVLTSHELSPHLSQRRMIRFTDRADPVLSWDPFDCVVLNRARPGWRSSIDYVDAVFQSLEQSEAFELVFEQDQVFVFWRLINNTQD